MRLRAPSTISCAIARTAGALCVTVLAACGGGTAGDETIDAQAAQQSGDAKATKLAAAAPTPTLKVGIRLPGFPHKVDVYQPAGATKAIVFLHGHGGTTWQLAHDLGFNRVLAPVAAKNVDWDWLARNGIIAIFAQGQALPGTTRPTWNNYVFDSGQDDVAFLKSLATYVRTQLGATEVSLSGHSSGGTMTARMWCEAPTSYKAFVSLAGPMPSPTYPQPGPMCVPLAHVPYYVLIGSKDTKLPMFTAGVTAPTPAQTAAGLTSSVLTAEWTRHQARSDGICGETSELNGAIVDTTGSTWAACQGHSRYTVVADADHSIASLEQNAHARMVDLIAGFVK